MANAEIGGFMANLKYNKEATKCVDCGKELAAKGGFINKEDGKCRCCYCYSAKLPPFKLVLNKKAK